VVHGTFGDRTVCIGLSQSRRRLQTFPVEGHRLNPSQTAEPMEVMKQLHRQRSKRRWRIQAHGRYQRYTTNSMAAGHPTASLHSFWPCALCPRVLGTERSCFVSERNVPANPALAWWNGSRNLATRSLTSADTFMSLRLARSLRRRFKRYFWRC